MKFDCKLTIALISIALALSACGLVSPVIAENEAKLTEAYTVTEMAAGLQHPWGIAFLPNGDALITEREGGIRRLSKNGELLTVTSTFSDKAVVKGQGGILGIAIHPDFENNHTVYICVNVAGKGGSGSEVHTSVLKGDELIRSKAVFIAQPKSTSGQHFGCRITFDNNQYMYVSLGDRGSTKKFAQDLTLHYGKTIRLKDNGDIPTNNPFVGKFGADDIYTYGHRNVQGMTLHPVSGKIWTHEHGPKGGDEINILEAGNNYGWPLITYGVNYNGTSISDKTEMPGMQQPLRYWDPSIAPSGMDFYTGDMFPDWQGNLLVGSLKFRYLLRIELDKQKVLAQHELLKDRNERIRDVVQAPDGSIYVLTDSSNGKILRISAQ